MSAQWIQSLNPQTNILHRILSQWSDIDAKIKDMRQEAPFPIKTHSKYTEAKAEIESEPEFEYETKTKITKTKRVREPKKSKRKLKNQRLEDSDQEELEPEIKKKPKNQRSKDEDIFKSDEPQDSSIDLMMPNADIDFFNSNSTSISNSQKTERKHKMIHIRQQQRNGKKCFTLIEGLSSTSDLSTLLHQLKKEFNTNGTLLQDTEDETVVIQIQGDFRKECQQFLIINGHCEKNEVKIHGF